MTIAQLEYFIAVVNHGSFSTAARHCCLTQPSLSVQISNLEDELGAKLLDRSRKPIVPTETGRLVVEQARKAVASFYGPKECVNILRGSTSGRLRLGVSFSVSPYLMPLFIPHFSKANPEVSIDVRDMDSDGLVDSLKNDLIDVAILSGGFSGDGIRETHLFYDNIYLYVSTKHPFFGQESVDINELSRHGVRVIYDGICVRRITPAPATDRKTRVAPCNFVNCSLETVINTVDATACSTIVPGMAVGYMSHERRRQIVRFGNETEVRRDIVMAVSQHSVRDSLFGAVRESVMAVAPELYSAEALAQ